METIFLPESNIDKWNAFVDASPEGSLFAKTYYLDALGTDYKIIIVRDNQVIQGGIVLTTDKWGYHVNPVLCKYLGILFRGFEGHTYTIESKRREVQHLLLEELKALPNFDYTFHPDFGNWMLFERAGYKQSIKYTYRIDLEEVEGKQALLDLMSTRLRNKVNKATRESGHQIELTGDVRSILPLIKKTYERQKIQLPFELDKLTEMLEVLKAKSNLQLFVSKDGNGNVGAVLGLFYDKRTAYLILNGIDDANSDRGVNEVLIHEGILWADKTGLKCFDFEGSMIPAVESFYRQFGGKLQPYHLIWKKSRKRKLRKLKQQFS